MKQRFLMWVAILALTILHTQARNTFAIVVDPRSYNEARTEIDAYAAAIRDIDGMNVTIITDHWGVPDSIRAALVSLYANKKEPLVGAVFVGDIPVAMVRDAQHMTSAFKMNQKNDRRDSSVPSDRFYDDFNLQFDAQGKDNEKPYFYYSLRPESAQTLRPSIYSGRIRPTDAGGTSRYAKLRAFLTKAAAEKRRQTQLQQMFFFSGHGYISESKVARMDEKAGLYEHFPWLRRRTDAISYMDHSDHNPVKEFVMNEVMRPDLDLAVLHHHGAPDTEYFNNIPTYNTPWGAKKYIQAYTRAHIRVAPERGKNADSIRTVFEQRFDVPSTWFADTFDPKVCERDSLDDAAQDLHLEDFAVYGYAPNSRVVIIDACFCGSFHLDDCIADEYIFAPGRTVSVVANSVNVLQDKWSDHLMGLIAMGGCVGDIVRYSGYLESHCIGDPTFRFRPVEKSLDIDGLIAADNTSAWRSLLKKGGNADLQSLAIHHLVQKGDMDGKELLEIYKSSPLALVRMQALTSLAKVRGDEFVEAIKLAVNDSYELVQRHALRYVGASGDDRLVPSLISVAIRNNTSDRCNFNAMTALAFYHKDKLMAEFARQFDSPDVAYINKDKTRKLIGATIERCAGKWTDDMDMITAKDSTMKKRLSAIRTLRNNCVHHYVPQLAQFVQTCGEPEIQVPLLEAMGWHRNSCHVQAIRQAALAMSKDESLPANVRAEALKTYNRVN